jgi:putative intracellular protease/amidase
MKTVHVAVYDALADWEVGLAIAHIGSERWQQEPGTWRVVTVGRTVDPVTTMAGVRILPDMALPDLRPADSAMLILPGADSWLDGSNADFAAKARDFVEAGVPVAAICGATGGLAAAGLLDDRRHTSNAAEFLAMTGYAGGACYTGEPATTDRLVTTGSGTEAVAFAREVLRVLGVYEPSVLDSWTKLYRDSDPAGFYELAAVGSR